MDVVGGTTSNWKTGSCFDIESFGCEVDVGTHIHDIPKPDIGYHCQQPEDTRVTYRIYTDDILADVFTIPQCYSQPHQNFDARGLWGYCVEYCANQTAIPASIHSKEQNNFVMALLKERTWLGMDNVKDGRVPTTWPYDNTLVDFTIFIKGYPKSDPLLTNIIMSNKDTEFGMWKNVKPENSAYPRNCFCQKSSVSGSPEPPPYPEVPANELCETNWIYMPSTQTCVFHDISFRAWEAAEQNCDAKGGHLVSINDPDTVTDLLVLGSAFNDPTSIGRHILKI